MNTRTVHELAAELAPTLGKGWRVGPAHDADGAYHGDHTARLYGPDDAEISAHVETWRAPARQRLILTAWAPFALTAHTDLARLPQITVSRSKPARLIAHDMQRRLLPAYREELNAARTRGQEHQAQQVARDAVVADLVEITHARLVDAAGGEVHFGGPDDRATGFFRITTADQGARVSLRVAPDAVLPLARALHALNTATPEPAAVRTP
ncbi:hypothetical protein GIY23_12905 [Allosaccharopolyspora coralli]|uniref:Uncharacterized protein n=1 Tax=Allosaccharopolyspora coralli TaxID=2665642 RepID=A0A5Q3QAS6_9PSEU|nr:hypothetical protein [Allosaccharopolyspora coralli]QGK70304.1 hypothetical protein GIY23_12905 [Allosaccharopolyspora coralli]